MLEADNDVLGRQVGKDHTHEIKGRIGKERPKPCLSKRKKILAKKG